MEHDANRLAVEEPEAAAVLTTPEGQHTSSGGIIRKESFDVAPVYLRNKAQRQCRNAVILERVFGIFGH